MSALAYVRSAGELPLFIHVLGALMLLGTLTLASVLLVSAWRRGSVASLRLGLRVFVFGVIPAWIVMRVAAEWVASDLGYTDLDLKWLDVGYIAGDAGLLLLLVGGISAWLALRRADGSDGTPATTAKVAAVALCLMLAVNVVALWAMTTKPV